MLDRIITLFDTETTGLGFSQGIVEIAVTSFPVRMLFEDKEPQVNVFLCNPEMEIQKAAFETHGISQEDVMFEPNIGQLWEQSLKGFFQDAHFVSGFNSEKFDVPLLNANLSRYGVPDAELVNLESLDVFKIHKKLTGRRGGKLSELCEEYGLEHTDQHRADGDVLATIRLLKYLIQTYGFEEVFGCLAGPEVPEETVEAARLYRETKLEMERLQGILDACKKSILDSMDEEQESLETPFLTVTTSPGRRNVDYKKLLADLELPDAEIEPYIKVSKPTKTIRLI